MPRPVSTWASDSESSEGFDSDNNNINNNNYDDKDGSSSIEEPRSRSRSRKAKNELAKGHDLGLHWVTFRKSNLNVHLRSLGDLATTSKQQPLCLHLGHLANFAIPQLPVQGTSGGRDVNHQDKSRPGQHARLQAHVSLFNQQTKRFFGNTWVSSLGPTSTSKKRSKHILGHDIFFFSHITDPRCVAVVEIVAVIESNQGSIASGISTPSSTSVASGSTTTRDGIRTQFGCGWTMVPLSQVQSKSKDGQKGTGHLPLFSGSPRALVLMEPGGEDKLQLQVNKSDHRPSLSYRFTLNNSLMSVNGLVREHEMVSYSSIIPGLRPVRVRNDTSSSPQKTSVSMAPCLGSSSVMKVNGSPSKTFKGNGKEGLNVNLLPRMVAILSQLTVYVQSALEDEICKGLERLHGVKVLDDGHFSLRFAAHNGRTILGLKADAGSEWQTTKLRTGDSVTRGDVDYDVLLQKKILPVPGLVQDPKVALVFELVYTASMEVVDHKRGRSRNTGSNEAQINTVNMVVGCGQWIPSNGKTTLLSSGPTKKSKTRQPIELELRTDVQPPFSIGSTYVQVSPSVARPLVGFKLKIDKHVAKYKKLLVQGSGTKKKKKRNKNRDGSDDDESEEGEDGDSDFGKENGNWNEGSDDSQEESNESDSDDSAKSEKSEDMWSEDEEEDESAEEEESEESEEYDDIDFDDDKSDEESNDSDEWNNDNNDNETRKNKSIKSKTQTKRNKDRKNRNKKEIITDDTQEQHAIMPALESTFTPAHLLGSSISGAEAFGPLKGSLLASSLSLPMHQTAGNVANKLGMGDELMSMPTNNGVEAMVHNSQGNQGLNGSRSCNQSGLRMPGRQSSEVHTLRPSTRQSNLTRSARTLLSQHGFADVLEGENGRGKGGKLVNGLALNDLPSVQIEVDDPLNAHEITFQFAAYRCAQGENVPQPRKVFFTFQFFNALPTRTERMSLVPGTKEESADSNEEQRRLRYQDGVSRPFILTRDTDVTGHRKQPSHAIRYLVDTSKYGPGEARAFAEYLELQTLRVQVWDAISLLPVGVVLVELSALMRQGDRQLKIANEYDIIQEDNHPSVVEVFGGPVAKGRLVGKVQIIFTNFGLKGTRVRPNTLRPDSIQRARLIMGQGRDPENIESENEKQRARPKQRVRARHLASTNPELQTLIHAAQMQAPRRPQQAQGTRPNGQHLPIGLHMTSEKADSYLLTNDDMDRLIARFDRYQCNEIDYQAFLKYVDLKGALVRLDSNTTVLLGFLGRVGKRVVKLEVQSEEANLLWAGFHCKDPQGEGVVPWSTFAQVLRDLGVGQVKRAEKTALLHRLRMDQAGVRARPNVGRTHVDYGTFVRLVRATMTGGDGTDARDVICRLQTALAKASKSGLTLQDALRGASGRTGRVRLDQLRQVLQNDFAFVLDDHEFQVLVRNFCEEGSRDTLVAKDFIRFVTKPMLMLEDNDTNNTQEQNSSSTNEDTDNTGGMGGSATQNKKTSKDSRIFQENKTRTRVAKASRKAERELRRNVNRLLTKLVDVLDTAETRGMSLTDSFKHFDVDGRGEISHKQFATGLVDLGFTPARAELDCLTRRFDLRKNGTISRREFVELLEKSRLKHAFAKLRSELVRRNGTDLYREFSLQDSEGTGRVNVQTAKATLTALGLSQVHVGALIEHIMRDVEDTTTAERFVYGDLVDQVKDLSVERLTDEEDQGNESSSAEEEEDEDEEASGGGGKPNPKSLAEIVAQVVVHAEEEGIDVHQVFQHFDIDRNGNISNSEMAAGLRELGIIEFTQKDLDGLVAEMDYDSTGEVDYAEFLRFVRQRQLMATEGEAGANSIERQLQLVITEARSRGLDPEKCFQVFDENGDGTISRAELKHVLEDLGMDNGNNITDEHLSKVIGKYDLDFDGRINFKEFVVMFESGEGGMKGNSGIGLKALQQKRQQQRATRRVLAGKLRTALVEANVQDQDVEHAFASSSGSKNGGLERRGVARALRKLHVRDSGALPDEIVKVFKLETRNEKDLRNNKDIIGENEKRNDKLARQSRAQVIRFFELCCDPNGDNDAAASDGEGLDGDGANNSDASGDSMGSDEDSNDSDGGPNKHIKDGGERKLRRKVRRVVKQSVLRGMEIQRLFANYDKADSGVMSALDFEQALMDVGFSVYRSIGDVAAGGGGVGGRLDHDDSLALIGEGENDEERLISARRKLELLQVHRQRHNVAPKNESKRYREAMNTWGEAGFGGGEFSEQLTALDMVNRYREAQKRVVVSDMLKRAVTTKITLFPSFGSTQFFEFQFTNPYPTEGRFSIKFSDPELRVVTDATEWMHYREHIPCATGHTYGHVENEMLSDGLELSMRRGETVSIPFVFLSFSSGLVDERYSPTSEGLSDAGDSVIENKDYKTGPSNAGGINSIMARTIPVTINSERHDHTVSLLQIQIKPRHFAVHRAMQFWNTSNEFFRRCFRLHPSARAVGLNTASANAAASVLVGAAPMGMAHSCSMVNNAPTCKFVHCPDGDVVVEWKEVAPTQPQEVYIKYRCGEFPAAGSFHVLLYNDPYHAQLHSIWHISIQTMLRLDVHAVLGQGVTKELVVKGDHYPRRVKCWSSEPGEVRFLPKPRFQLVAGAYNRIEMAYRPLSTSRGSIAIHMTDCDTGELVCGWLASTSTSVPVITKTFEVNVPVGRGVHKKVAYMNPWEHGRTFLVHSSDSAVCKVREPQMEVRGMSKEYIRLWITEAQQAGSREVLIFVNDQDDQNEECLLVKINYG